MPVSELSVGANYRILGLVALGDLLVGLVLSVIGVVADVQAMAIAGVVLLCSGGGMLAWVILRRNKPEAL